jgi:hypothetical protein
MRGLARDRSREAPPWLRMFRVLTAILGLLSAAVKAGELIPLPGAVGNGLCADFS